MNFYSFLLPVSASVLSGRHTDAELSPFANFHLKKESTTSRCPNAPGLSVAFLNLEVLASCCRHTGPPIPQLWLPVLCSRPLSSFCPKALSTSLLFLGVAVLRTPLGWRGVLRGTETPGGLGPLKVLRPVRRSPGRQPGPHGVSTPAVSWCVCGRVAHGLLFESF